MAYTSKYTGKQIDERLDHMVNVTWEELKALRDGGKLIAGQMYRMTDYETMTAQEGTQAAGHPFDLILTALDEKTLDEKCSAIQSARDIDGYFANSNLNAWQVWYTIDNDASKGSWAVTKGAKCTIDLSTLGLAGYATATYSGTTFDYNSVTYYRYDVTIEGLVCYLLTSTEYPSAGDAALLYLVDFAGTEEVSIYSASVIEEDGKGVLYRLIDEKRNDVPYDFKNMMFKYGDTEVYLYTFSYDASTATDTSITSENVYGNVFGRGCFNNIFLGESFYSNTFGDGCRFNTFGTGCYFTTFGDNCYSNTFGTGCYFTTFGDNCYSNTFETNCSSNTFGNDCYSNELRYKCYSNTFGDNCYSNTLGESCYSNTFGDGCCSNHFIYKCQFNTFGSYCRYNKFGEIGGNFYYKRIRLADYNQYITLFGTGSTWSSLQDYEINLNYGTSSAPIEYTLVADRTSKTYVINNGGTAVEYTELDLYNLINA